MKRNPLIYLFGKTWEYSEGNRKSVVMYWTMFIIANVSSLVVHPLILATIFTTLQKEGVTQGNFGYLIQLLLANLSITFIFWGFHGPARCIERANAFRVRAGYCMYLVRGILTLPLDWHSEHHTGDTIDKIEKGRQGIYAFASESFFPIYSGVRLVVSVFMLSYASYSAGMTAFVLITLVVLLMIALTVWVVMKFDRKIVENYTHLNRADNLISASIIDAMSHITTVITLRAEKSKIREISRNVDAPFALYKATNHLSEAKWFFVSVNCAVMWTLVLGIYFWRHIDVAGGIIMGSVFLLIRYLDEMSDLFQRFTDMYGEILQRRSKIQNAEESTGDFREENFTNHVLPPTWRTIEVQNLNFAYKSAEGDTLHLTDISLSIQRGERIALVGWSGSGKSTLLKVLLGLYELDSYKLLVDGEQVADGFPGIKRDISLVTQIPEIFATTIRNNITIGEDHPEEKVRHYTDMACFSQVVDRLPRGLESVINEKGVNLSGGERQRLALARGLLASEGKSLILIDEPTSSVDEASKHRIYNNIFREFKGTSIVFATHELHLLPLFDRIYVFEGGRIVGSGTVESLTATCPEFNELCSRSDEERAS